ncbi:MAG: transporter substrate-binding domain-containing protein [Hyphomicrobiales bacterium]|nr:transporter substrate-binding domain-containing protein [Hyphomicrobiales bacterium]MCP5374188.1 transporter substrate-binding domain-containing protein [Hyphomicrobiales bacterium]
MRRAVLHVVLFIVIMAVASAHAQADGSRPVKLRIATTPAPSSRVTHDPARPGWIIELLNRVERQANVTFDYVFEPWDQCLRLVRTGLVQAVFNSSFKPDRAAYGAYPMRDGKPDASRANLHYAYHLYVRKGSGIAWDGQTLSGVTAPVAVERKAAIIPLLEKLGTPYLEAETYTNMIILVRTGRADAMAGIAETVAPLLAKAPGAADQIVQVTPPLQERAGYLMFSKRYCAKRGAVCEAVWNAVRTVRASPEYQAVKAGYHAD